MAKQSRKTHTAKRRVEGAWHQAVKALRIAEAEAERQLRKALAEDRFGSKQAVAGLKKLGGRLERERKTLQARVAKESRAAGRAVSEAVQQTLAALNIPSRREVSELTRKVDELSRKIDVLKRKKR